MIGARVLIFKTVVCVLTACGAGRSQQTAPRVLTQAPATKPRENAKPLSNSSASKPMIETLGNLTGTKHGEAITCQIVHVGNGLLVTAAHCAEGVSSLAGSWPAQRGTAFPLRVLETVETASTEVESVTFLTPTARFITRTSVDISAAYVESSLSYPSPLVVKFLDENGAKAARACVPRRYNEEGLVAYDCETAGGMSGALVEREQDGKPIAIHIGRLSGLGYGAGFLSFALRAKERIAKDLEVHDD